MIIVMVLKNPTCTNAQCIRFNVFIVVCVAVHFLFCCIHCATCNLQHVNQRYLLFW